MRLFTGVELDEGVKAAAADVAARARERLQRVAPDLVARWVAADSLHISLWFIGEVEEDRAAAVVAALEPALPAAPFELALAGCGAFPPSGAPRVLWMGLRAGADAMARLYRDVGARLAPLGFLPERRSYTAHLTLARVKDGGRAAPRAIRQALADLPADAGACRIAAVTLFRSRLSPRGAAYEPLLRVPLEG